MGLFRIVSCGGITIEVMSNTRTTTKMPAKPENEWNTQLVFYKYISLEFGAHSVWLILPKNKYVIIVLYKIGWEASDILVNGLLNVNQVTNRMLKIGHNSIQLYFSWKPWDYYDLNWCGDGVSDELSMYYYWITLIHRNKLTLYSPIANAKHEHIPNVQYNNWNIAIAVEKKDIICENRLDVRLKCVDSDCWAYLWWCVVLAAVHRDKIHWKYALLLGNAENSRRPCTVHSCRSADWQNWLHIRIGVDIAERPFQAVFRTAHDTFELNFLQVSSRII